MGRSFWRIAAMLAIPLATAGAVHAAGVVGTGTPESCTEAALDAALGGGGAVTFDCGVAPHTIVVTTVQLVTADVDIDGGGLITLSGGNSSAFFTVADSATLIINELTLTRGFGDFGAIQNAGTLIIRDSRIEQSISTGEEGGAVSNYGSLTITATTFAENASEYHGGAIFSYGGTVDIAESTFVDNSTIGSEDESGGAIYGFFFAGIFVEDSSFTGNFSQRGGAIVFDGLGAVTNVAFVNNHADDVLAGPIERGGGALYVAPTAEVVVSESRFEGNEALAAAGGAIIVRLGGSLDVERSTFTENGAFYGGAIANGGNLAVFESTFYGNTAVTGGAALAQGLENAATSGTFLENSTVSDNDTQGDGTISAISGSFDIVASTVAGNTGSGFFSGGFLSSTVARFSNSIFAYNTPSDCSGSVAIDSLGFNISSDDSCQLIAVGDDPSTDPLLGPLADNGGPTLTRLPAPLSPAIDEAQCVVPNDQRGVARPQGEACDRGAVERSPEDPTTSCGDPVALVASRTIIVDAVSASDALAVLNAAVGLFACELCVCDVDGSASISATDALQTLRTAVGLGGVLACPACT